jgi:predicted HTH domain antitoxin
VEAKEALEYLREGRMTLMSAAKLAGLTYLDMLDEAEKAGIFLNYTAADLQLDLKAIKKEG